MLSDTIQDAINDQIRTELHSAYQYLSMAAYCESMSLPGFAQWMQQQSREEVDHAMRFYNFVNDRGGRVMLQSIDRPMADFDSPLAVFQAALQQEQQVTQSINNLYGLAMRENDYASQALLQWFVTEQVEEEKTVSQIVDDLERIGDKSDALLMFDRELGRREHEPEA